MLRSRLASILCFPPFLRHSALGVGQTFSGADIITKMRAWVTAGFAPQNRALCGAGASWNGTVLTADGSDIGAVPCLPTLPPVITGPLTCQQGQTCSYRATGGTPPYTFSMVTGSVGSVAAGAVNPMGVYSAPTHVVPKQVINGCQGLPNNNIFNTRIDALPLHPKSYLWMVNTDGAGSVGIGGGFRMNGSVALSTDQPLGMKSAPLRPQPAPQYYRIPMLNGVGHHFFTFDGPDDFGIAAGYQGTDPFGVIPGSGNNQTPLDRYPDRWFFNDKARRKKQSVCQSDQLPPSFISLRASIQAQASEHLP